MIITEISWKTILTVWQFQLWPGRKSLIETHSAMTWPYSDNTDSIDITIFDRPASYWGIWDNDLLVGVNSGHGTTDTEYRSRGLWVDDSWRHQGLAQRLLTHTSDYARDQGYDMIWSLPRISAINTYRLCGFSEVGDHFATETSELNVYVRKYL